MYQLLPSLYIIKQPACSKSIVPLNSEVDLSSIQGYIAEAVYHSIAKRLARDLGQRG